MYPIVIQCLVDTIYKAMSSHNKTIVQNCHNIIFNSIITLGNLGEAALTENVDCFLQEMPKHLHVQGL